MLAHIGARVSVERVDLLATNHWVYCNGKPNEWFDLEKQKPPRFRARALPRVDGECLQARDLFVAYTHATHFRSCAFAQAAVSPACETLRLPPATVHLDCCYAPPNKKPPHLHARAFLIGVP
jgi:hypothetical protein